MHKIRNDRKMDSKRLTILPSNSMEGVFGAFLQCQAFHRIVFVCLIIFLFRRCHFHTKAVFQLKWSKIAAMILDYDVDRKLVQSSSTPSCCVYHIYKSRAYRFFPFETIEEEKLKHPTTMSSKSKK
jgi:hypothetical protein